MNRVINGKTYELSISLFWGSDNTDIESIKDTLNSTVLDDNNIIQLDIISSLVIPFVYGSFIYSDSKSASRLLNMIDMPLVHGTISFCVVDGTDIPGENPKNKPLGNEYFIESIFITGVETVDGIGDNVAVKFNFASSDIMKFTSNIEGISTFDKSNGDKEEECVNDTIRKLFASAKLSEKLDLESFTANSGISVRYINSSNENLISALDYVYRKTFDDNFSNTKDCSYVRIRYNHNTHKYEQWRYDDIGTTRLFSKSDNEIEMQTRDLVVVDTLKPYDPCVGHGTFRFSNSGNSMCNLENYEFVKYINYDYAKNSFHSKGYGMLDKIIVDHSNVFNDKMVSRAKVINDHGDLFKDVDYMHEFTTSNQNGSVYDIITDSIFNSNFYRVESDGSIGRKAGDGIIINFSNSMNTIYETMDGDYLITAIDNRYEADGNGGYPSFRSIMDVHRPFIVPDSQKHELSV